MTTYDFDLFVVGAGSGGVRAARMAARYGAKVAVAERDRVGGTCVIRGCVPKKLLMYASEFAEAFRDAAGYGWQVDHTSFDWRRLIANKDREIDRLNQVYIRALTDSGVTLLTGNATLAGPHEIDLSGQRITAETILLATGGHPVKPDIPGAEFGISSDDAFHLPILPGHILVLGAGYIGLEFAGIFNGLGVEVNLVFRGQEILRGFDNEVRSHLAMEMLKKGVTLLANRTVTRILRQEDRYRVSFDRGEDVITDLVFFATGRAPNSDLNLATAGVACNPDGAIQVNNKGQTTADNIYAIGDCTNRLNLTPVAIREGAAFADRLYGGRPVEVEYDCVPHAVFSQPPVGAVGWTEEAARAKFGDIDIYKAMFRPMQYALAGRDERMLMKLVVDAKTDRVLGVHLVGPDAPEMIQLVAIPVKMRATKAEFDATMALHPTAAEELVTMRQKWQP